jgi:hypothetical protein
MPEVLSLRHLPNFLSLLPVHLPAYLVLLQRAEVFTEDFELVTAKADALELLEDDPFLEAVEGNL